MIQRVQSIWLFLAALSLFLFLILPVLSRSTETAVLSFQIGGLYQKAGVVTEKIESYVLPFGLTVLAGICCIANIFLFRNRTLQKRLIILIVLLVGIAVGFLIVNGMHIPGGLEGASVTAGAFMPVLALVFCALALRGIRQDEQLIRSADRLR